MWFIRSVDAAIVANETRRDAEKPVIREFTEVRPAQELPEPDEWDKFMIALRDAISKGEIGE